jgi:hypothetical protein
MPIDESQSTINPPNGNTDHADTSGISTTPLADQRHDAHRAIADEWLQRAMQGIREMHRNEDFRREVAKRLF